MSKKCSCGKVWDRPPIDKTKIVPVPHKLGLFHLNWQCDCDNTLAMEMGDTNIYQTKIEWMESSIEEETENIERNEGVKVEIESMEDLLEALPQIIGEAVYEHIDWKSSYVNKDAS